MGGDLAAIRSALTERGLVIASEEGEQSYTFKDPDGRDVFFDTTPPERLYDD